MNSPKSFSVIGGLALLIASIAPSVHATVMLDQAVETSNGGVNAGFGLAQTFTVGITGNLVQVDVSVFTQPTETARIQILGTQSDGSPDPTTILATATQNLPVINPPLFTSIDLSTFSIPVSIGDVLAIEIVNTGATLNWFFDNRAVYPLGGAFIADTFGSDGKPTSYTPFNSPASARGSDLLFRTFVDTAVNGNGSVPEPTTLVLLGLGLAGLGFARRRLH